LASGSEARLYDLDRGRVLQRWPLSDGSANHMQLDARGRRLLLRREKCQTSQRRVWRLYELGAAPSAILLQEQTEGDWSVHNMAFAPGGDRFLVWHRPAEAPGTNVLIHAYALL
jgi:hypothetical protein